MFFHSLGTPRSNKSFPPLGLSIKKDHEGNSGAQSNPATAGFTMNAVLIFLIRDVVSITLTDATAPEGTVKVCIEATIENNNLQSYQHQH